MEAATTWPPFYRRHSNTSFWKNTLMFSVESFLNLFCGTKCKNNPVYVVSGIYIYMLFRNPWSCILAWRRTGDKQLFVPLLIFTGPARVEWLWVNDFGPNEYHIWHGWPTTCWWRTTHQNMKYQSSLRRRVITGGSQKDVRVSRKMDCPIGVIKFHVSANN